MAYGESSLWSLGYHSQLSSFSSSTKAVYCGGINEKLPAQADFLTRVILEMHCKESPVTVMIKVIFVTVPVLRTYENNVQN